MDDRMDINGSVEWKSKTDNEWIGYCYIKNLKIEENITRILYDNGHTVDIDSVSPLTQYWCDVKDVSSPHVVTIENIISYIKKDKIKVWNTENEPQTIHDVCSLCKHIQEQKNMDISVRFVFW